MVDIYKNIKDYNPNKKPKILIIFDDMISDMLSNKKNLIQYQLNCLLRRKTKHLSCFITKSYFAVPKDITLNCTHYFIMETPNK